MELCEKKAERLQRSKSLQNYEQEGNMATVQDAIDFADLKEWIHTVVTSSCTEPATHARDEEDSDARWCKDHAPHGSIDVSHHKAKESKLLFDNHHSPMKPGQYINARLLPMLDYYQSRLPRKYCKHKVTNFLAVLATSAIAIMSFLNMLTTAGVIGAFATAIATWQAESGTDRKITRCEF
eukprot:SAG31_NODE_936_length_10870_cov_5.136966_7_plen_181_part_00